MEDIDKKIAELKEMIAKSKMVVTNADTPTVVRAMYEFNLAHLEKCLELYEKERIESL